VKKKQWRDYPRKRSYQSYQIWICATNSSVFLSAKYGISISFNNKYVNGFLFFDNNTNNLGRQEHQQVTSLDISSCNMDLFSLLSLPRLFPNLKNFSWSDSLDYTKVLNNNTLPQKKLYASKFAK
jgi:hypothetical protein